MVVVTNWLQAAVHAVIGWGQDDDRWDDSHISKTKGNSAKAMVVKIFLDILRAQLFGMGNNVYSRSKNDDNAEFKVAYRLPIIFKFYEVKFTIVRENKLDTGDRSV